MKKLQISRETLRILEMNESNEVVAGNHPKSLVACSEYSCLEYNCLPGQTRRGC
jgi:hypothetical protein